jgi:hypothetical protein
MIKHCITRHLSVAALVATGVLALAGVLRPAQATTVATIQGAYDKDLYDTPELDFFNTSGGSLINAKMVLTGYQRVEQWRYPNRQSERFRGGPDRHHLGQTPWLHELSQRRAPRKPDLKAGVTA